MKPSAISSGEGSGIIGRLYRELETTHNIEPYLKEITSKLDQPVVFFPTLILYVTPYPGLHCSGGARGLVGVAIATPEEIIATSVATPLKTLTLFEFYKHLQEKKKSNLRGDLNAS